jgi:hypothetical protein
MTEITRLLHIQVINPRVETEGGRPNLVLQPLGQETKITDFRKGVDMSHFCARLPKMEISSRYVVVANVDREELKVIRDGSNGLKIASKEVTYLTEENLMTGFLQNGYGRMVQVPNGTWLRRTIGRVKSGDIEGHLVLMDYRYNFDGRQRDKMVVDALMVHGSKKEMKNFLRRVAGF